jgi:hypothetical protein
MIKDMTIKLFISYSHDNPAHSSRVLSLSNQLCEDGYDCQLDQYDADPAQGWTQWMSDGIKEADFVLMVCTQTYQRRVTGDEPPGDTQLYLL